MQEQEEQQSSMEFDGGGPDHERLRKHAADFTPEPVVEQFIRYLARFRRPPDLVLDPSCGPGVFGKVIRRVWPKAIVVGIEPRTEEMEHAMRNNHRVLNTEYGQALSSGLLDATLRDMADKIGRKDASFDLVVTNPPFPLWRDFVRDSLPLLHDRGQPRPGYLALLGLNGWGARSEAGFDLFEELPPTRQSRIPGTINFRGPGINPKTKQKWASDTRDYSWWQWSMRAVHRVLQQDEHRIPWASENLPRLPGADRKWTVKPGTD